ncbi:putative beta-lysine N-acetyltransferase [Herbivorax sp. ANBcel31]|uniref:putative beta-lysine N-acetyltransferase n=1 Tax=Herbivorax sp. ANBcel31 TaxID=3069754 RepID=UPI0027B05CA1|nr:putative beta-lysine N-acetyltransferase [Herbivorax sp. ANBcel31]MDQ2085187.1 putative beta-lysine N-acetyltransferase [Herbivorax sp. ANBcel31]
MFDLKEESFKMDYWQKTVKIEPISKRMKVYQLPSNYNNARFVSELKELAKEKKCDKIILYVKKNERKLIDQNEFHKEGFIKGFFNGDTAYIYSLFCNPKRKTHVSLLEEQNVLKIVAGDNKTIQDVSMPQGYTMRRAAETDVFQMAKLYTEVFKTYPTPMNDPDYIIEAMNNHVYFTVIEKDGEIISACSADVLPEFEAAELTDCSTLPLYRGKGLLTSQFFYLIDFMKKKNIKTVFSYSRAVSVGMNLINKRFGFKYGGRLIQNSNISGRLETMNIWYKNI